MTKKVTAKSAKKTAKNAGKKEAKKTSSPKPLETLTAKQKFFVEEYINGKDLNATAAARRAGYSEKSCRQTASDNMANPYIQDAIQKAMSDRSERNKITSDDVLQEISKMAFANISDYVNWSDGAIAIIESSKLNKDQMAAVSEISENVTATGSNVKIKLHDKKGSLELLGRHLKLFTDKTEVSGNIGLTDLSDAELTKKQLELERAVKKSLED